MSDSWAEDNTASANHSDDGAEDIEKFICLLFGRVVASDRTVSPDVNFFEAGGASIGALRVIASIEDKFGVRIPLRSFFSKPTPRALAALVRGRAAG